MHIFRVLDDFVLGLNLPAELQSGGPVYGLLSVYDLM